MSEPEFLGFLVEMGDIEHADWFPLVDGEGGWVVMDCHGGSPTWDKVAGYPEDGMPDNFPTLSESLDRWAGYLEQRVWLRDPESRWLDHRTDTDQDLQAAQGNLA